MMNYFYVTFQWYETDIYCANICKADCDHDVYSHYGMHNHVMVRKADSAEVMTAKHKGMPIVEVGRCA